MICIHWQFESYSEANTLSVDGFLYEEDDIDELCDAGKLTRNYCLGKVKNCVLCFVAYECVHLHLQNVEAIVQNR
jgi:hypothetical protein